MPYNAGHMRRNNSLSRQTDDIHDDLYHDYISYRILHHDDLYHVYISYITIITIMISHQAYKADKLAICMIIFIIGSG